MIPAGANQDSACIDELQRASLVVCLLSIDFLTSQEYLRLCNSPRIDGAIPVLLRDVLVEDTPFHGHQLLPREGGPLLSRNKRDRDTALVDVVRAIKQKTQLQITVTTDWLQAYRDHVVDHSREDISTIMNASSRHHYEEALSLCDRKRDRLEALLRIDTASPELREFVSVFRLITGTLRLSLQMVESARAILDSIDDSVLLPEARCALAECLAQVDRIPRARALVQDNPSLAALQTRQLIELVEERIPVDLQDVPWLHSRASFALLWKQRLPEAVIHARRAIEQAPEHPIIAANSVVVLIIALILSVNEHQDVTDRLSHKCCAEVVRLLEKELRGLLQESRTPPLPPRLRRNVVLWVAGFADLTDDPFLLSGQDVEGVLQDLRAGEAGTLFSLPPLQHFIEAIEQQDPRLLEEVLSSLPELSPWNSRLLWLQLGHRTGWPPDQALLKELLALAKAFPGRSPIEYWTAKMLFAVDRYQEAFQHARVAFQALPARWYRLFLMVCALRIGDLQEAERHVDALRESGLPPSVLRTLLLGQALVTELVDQKRANAHWKRYLDEQRAHLRQYPADASRRMELACAHHHCGRYVEAARLAFLAVQEDAQAKLEVRELTLAIMLQHVDGHINEERARRAQAITATLRERYPRNETAESWLAALTDPRGRSETDAAIERWMALLLKAFQEQAGLDRKSVV